MAKKRRIIKVGQESGEKDLSDRVAQYDPSVAVHYGQFVEIAYRMYESAPNNPTPNPPSPLPCRIQVFSLDTNERFHYSRR
jgi:hypothetical protein